MPQSRRSPARRKTKGRPSADEGRSWPRLDIDARDVEKALKLFFPAATAAGLLVGLGMAFSIPLDSDMANAGLYPMEIARGSFQYVLPANNPYLFTDYIFHAVVQPLSGYSPVALVLTCYALFILIVLASALLVWRLAGPFEALAAAALVANLPYTALMYAVAPLYHAGTVLYILLSLIVIFADRPPLRLPVQGRLVIVALLQLLGVLSDTLMLPLFTLPLVVYFGYRALRKGKAAGAGEPGGHPDARPVLWLATAVPALIAFAYKMRGGPLWPGGPIMYTGSAIGSLLVRVETISQFADALTRDAGGLVAVIALFGVAAVVLKRRDYLVYVMLGLGLVLMLAGFASITLAGDAARYLIALVVLAFIVIATGTRPQKGEEHVIPLAAALAIIVVCIVTTALTLSITNLDPNAVDREMVAYLESSNVTHGYADYWTANLDTYLSGGRAVIEPCTVADGRLQLYNVNVAPRWAQVWPDGNDTRPVVITKSGDSLYAWAQKINAAHPPEVTLNFGDKYMIYVYNGTLPAWPAPRY